MAQAQRSGRSRDGREPTTAFVLSGGGNQGVSQVGMLRALLERGIRARRHHRARRPVRSTGRVCHRPDTHRRSTTSRRSGSVSPAIRSSRATLRAGLEPPAPRRPHHQQRRPARGHRRAQRPARRFGDLQVPLRVVAADLRHRREVVLVERPASPPCWRAPRSRGSSRPSRHGGRLLVDGAVVNLVPISHALAGPIDRIFVLDVSDPIGDRPIRSPLDVVVRAFAISRDQRFDLELQ